MYTRLACYQLERVYVSEECVLHHQHRVVSVYLRVFHHILQRVLQCSGFHCAHVRAGKALWRFAVF